MLEGIREFFSSLGKDKILLERVPADLRRSIWDARPGELGKTINLVNQRLLTLDLPGLTGIEVDDAMDGNEWINRGQARLNRDYLEGLPVTNNAGVIHR